MKVTFPHMGNTYIPAKMMLDEFGVDYVIPPYNNKESLEIGTKYAPESACLPLKINVGNFIHAYEKGADTVIITGGRGPCRFGYYAELHREILKDAGYDMDIISLELPDQGIRELLKRIKKLSGTLNVFKIVKIMAMITKIAKMVDELEALTFWVRPREIEKGAVDKIYKVFQRKVIQAKGYSEIKKLILETRRSLLAVEQNEDYKPLRVGIVGEIYTTIDPFANMNIASTLGNMGVEVNRYVTVSGWIIEHMIKNALHLPRDLSYAQAAKPYLGAMIGGHAQETVGNTVQYAQDGFDGIIQIYPLTCMPEIVAENILPKIGNDYNIPILTLIIDEMTGEAGYLTRVEAFVDLLNRRRERVEGGEDLLLFGN
ncbi:MAG: CoA protein activase [Clostridia bacterium]|nr:CoA protein activase [Clostridia bacterium]